MSEKNEKDDRVALINQLQGLGVVFDFDGKSDEAAVSPSAALMDGFRGDESKLRGLEAFPSIKIVCVTESRIGKTTMTILSSLPRLEELSLHGSAVGDDCLPILQRMRQLRILVVGATELSDQSMVDLAAAMPWCEVYKDADKPRL